jgi:hypothetical protein
MNMQMISNEMVVAQFGDRHDGIQVYKNDRAVGFLTDLRTTMSRNAKKKIKQKEYSTRYTEEKREAMPEAVNAMVEFLSNNLKDADVFINISQPNVHIKGAKFYLICDPLTDKTNRLGISSPAHTSEELCWMFETNKIQCDGPKNVLINSLSRDEIIEIINKVVSEL